MITNSCWITVFVSRLVGVEHINDVLVHHNLDGVGEAIELLRHFAEALERDVSAFCERIFMNDSSFMVAECKNVVFLPAI